MWSVNMHPPLYCSDIVLPKDEYVLPFKRDSQSDQQTHLLQVSNIYLLEILLKRRTWWWGEEPPQGNNFPNWMLTILNKPTWERDFFCTKIQSTFSTKYSRNIMMQKSEDIRPLATRNCLRMFSSLKQWLSHSYQLISNCLLH